MSGLNEDGLSDFMRDRRGAGLVRWRGAWAFLSGAERDPRADPAMATILDAASEPWTSFFLQVWEQGRAEAARVVREGHLGEAGPPDPEDDRDGPKTPAQRAGERRRRKMRVAARRHAAEAWPASHPSFEPAFEATVWAFRWRGQLAYARGVDRALSHDVPSYKEALRHGTVRQLALVRAWDAGWDAGRDCAEQLVGEERRSPLEIPRAVETRLLHSRPEEGQTP